MPYVTCTCICLFLVVLREMCVSGIQGSPDQLTISMQCLALMYALYIIQYLCWHGTCIYIYVNMKWCEPSPSLSPSLSLSLSFSPCSASNQAIKLYNIQNKELINSIRYHDGFMGQKIGPTKSITFHPYKVSATPIFHT